VNYLLHVHAIDKMGDADEPPNVTIQLDGKLTAKAKRDLKNAIEGGYVTISENPRVIA
jgi:hypothetical protein